MTDQLNFLPEVEQSIPKEKKINCKFHRWALRDDFIEVEVKKTGLKKLKCRFCQRFLEENKKQRQAENEKEKEKLTDWYVAKTLRRGKYGLKSSEIPQSLIEAKRAVIQVNNLVKQIEAPLKTCSKHGKLFREQVIKAGKSHSGKPAWKCKECMKDMHKKHYELNKAKVLAQHAIYRKENPEKVAQTKRNWCDKNKEKYLRMSRERYKRWEMNNPEKANVASRNAKKKAVKVLADSYVKKSLVRHTGLSTKDLPNNLVQAQRAIMMLNRGLKIQQNLNKIIEENTNVED